MLMVSFLRMEIRLYLLKI
ncbi:UNVERIFIED_CONTAM: hypothetical protein GTU68_014352 [Idotea baltica]|nr:hypothetical protein [Idotea baltica]